MLLYALCHENSLALFSCYAGWTVGASRGVYAQIFAIQMGVRGASFDCGSRFFSVQVEFCHFGHKTTRGRAGIITGMGEPFLLHLRGVFDVKSGA